MPLDRFDQVLPLQGAAGDRPGRDRRHPVLREDLCTGVLRALSVQLLNSVCIGVTCA
jgi:hypothetical protein